MFDNDADGTSFRKAFINVLDESREIYVTLYTILPIYKLELFARLVSMFCLEYTMQGYDNLLPSAGSKYTFVNRDFNLECSSKRPSIGVPSNIIPP